MCWAQNLYIPPLNLNNNPLHGATMIPFWQLKKLNQVKWTAWSHMCSKQQKQGPHAVCISWLMETDAPCGWRLMSPVVETAFLCTQWAVYRALCTTSLSSPKISSDWWLMLQAVWERGVYPVYLIAHSLHTLSHCKIYCQKGWHLHSSHPVFMLNKSKH